MSKTGNDEENEEEPVLEFKKCDPGSVDYLAQVGAISVQIIAFASQMHSDPILVLTALKTAASMYENGLSGEAVRITLKQMLGPEANDFNPSNAVRRARAKRPPDERMN